MENGPGTGRGDLRSFLRKDRDVARHSRITKDRLLNDIRKMGIESGELVLLHSSLKSIGRVDGGPEAVIGAFIEAIGESGTLVVPTCISSFDGIKPNYDIEKTPSEAGLISETLRKMPGAMRSGDRVHSAAAIGPLAEEIVKSGKDHHRGVHNPFTPWGKGSVGFESPWDRLRANNATLVMIGVGFDKCTLMRHVQLRYVAEHEGVALEMPWPEFDFKQMGAILKDEGLVAAARIGDAAVLHAKSKPIVDRSLELLKSDPEMFFRKKSIREWWNRYTEIQNLGRPRAAAFKLNIMPRSVKQEVLRPLHIRGLLLDHPQTGPAALFVWDQIAFFQGDSDVIRAALSKATGIPAESILITATHTESGYWNIYGPDDAFVKSVAEKSADAAKIALSRHIHNYDDIYMIRNLSDYVV